MVVAALGLSSRGPNFAPRAERELALHDRSAIKPVQNIFIAVFLAALKNMSCVIVPGAAGKLNN
jgi:hypothetical protein